MADSSFLRKVLLEQSYISPDDAAAALKFEESGKGNAIDYLLQKEIINKATLGRAVAEHFGVSFADLDARTPSAADIAKIPEAVARDKRVVFVKEGEKSVTIATDTIQKGVIEALKPIFPGKEIVLVYAFPDGIDAALAHYQKELTTRFSEIVKHERRVAPELFEEIVKDALSFHASDIHFEPQTDQTVIRFRIDGMLRLAGALSRDHYESVLNRIKIQANLRTDEHFAPQDGAIRFASGSSIVVDMRVSVVPALEGEKTVIRLLAEYVRGLSFTDLGFSPANTLLLEKASKKPFGMILVAGPTGSGKTTTLYSLIRTLNTPEVNITTIEDPVEYRMEGTNQIQVNVKTDLTFAKGLRAVVRQDPNVILVGEIRDMETAETAVNAALTGHLLLSTFHANDAATCVPRLIEMGVEPFLLASTLELLVAQRLVRRICTSCRESYTEKPANLEKLIPNAKRYFGTESVVLFRSKGCSTCNGTGYQGRTSIIELIPVTPALKDLISRRPSAREISALAQSEGAATIFEDGLEKAKTGVTTIEEVFRVASPAEVSA